LKSPEVEGPILAGYELSYSYGKKEEDEHRSGPGEKRKRALALLSHQKDTNYIWGNLIGDRKGGKTSPTYSHDEEKGGIEALEGKKGGKSLFC